MITKHSYSGDTFDKLFNSYQPQNKTETQPEQQFVKVASGCVNCPYGGNVSATTCNTCKFAAGIAYNKGDTYIKCAYRDETGMTKEASSIQGIHWGNDSIIGQEAFDEVQSEMKNSIAEELKFAARNIGVKLAQDHFDQFTEIAFKDRLSGKKLERAARTFVTKIEERILPAEKRTNDDIFTLASKNPKGIISSTSSPTVGDNTSAGCGYMGSKTNPNTIWDSGLLKTAACTPGSDEITKKLKQHQADSKAKIKDSYWAALQEKLASKGLVPGTRVHSVATEESHGFNSNLPANAMSIFGEHAEFENIPEKTAGETLADQNKQRATKKSQSNSEVKIEASKTMESGNWLFSNVQS